jgi:hypothetical protein
MVVVGHVVKILRKPHCGGKQLYIGTAVELGILWMSMAC